MNNVEKVIIDTNIWVYYLNKDSKFHQISKDIIQNYVNENCKIYITSQIFRELLVVLTSVKFLEKPLTIKAAIEKVNEISNFVTILFESKNSNNKLKKLILENRIVGYKIHDINIIAVALENSINCIRTNNPKDFIAHNKIKIIGIKPIKK